MNKKKNTFICFPAKNFRVTSVDFSFQEARETGKAVGI